MPSHPLLRLQGTIDAAVQILQDQFELVTETLAEVEGLKNGKLDESTAKPLPVYNLSVGIIPCFTMCQKPLPMNLTIYYWGGPQDMKCSCDMPPYKYDVVV